MRRAVAGPVVVADLAAAVVVQVVADPAVVLPAAKVVEEVAPVVAVAVDKVVGAAVVSRVAADKVVVAAVSPAVAAEWVVLVVAAASRAAALAAAVNLAVVVAARVVVRVAVVVDAHPAAVDKAVAAGANQVVGVHPAVVVAGWEEAVVVAVRPEVAAAEPVNSSQSSGASRICGAPFFC